MGTPLVNALRGQALGRSAAGWWSVGRAWVETWEPVLIPLSIGLLHLAIVQVVASLAFLTGHSTGSSSPYKPVLGDPPAMTGLAHVLVEPLRRWDGLWYAL